MMNFVWVVELDAEWMYWLLESFGSWVFGGCTNINYFCNKQKITFNGPRVWDRHLSKYYWPGGKVDVTSNNETNGMTRPDMMTRIVVGSLFYYA